MKNYLFRIVFSIAAVLQLTSPTRADLITNGSFESGPFIPNSNNAMSLSVGSTPITGWTVTNAEIAWLNTPNPFDILASEGAFLLDLTGIHDSSPYGGVSQSIATTVGEGYTLGFDLGSYESNSLFRGPVSVTASAAGSSATFTTSPSGIGNQWQTFSLAFTATSNITTVNFVGATSAGGHYIGLDWVSVYGSPQPVPEPSSLTLFVLGGIGVIGKRMRRRLSL